jgi:hypothetical protein
MGDTVKSDRDSDWDSDWTQVAIAGAVLFTAGLTWTARYTLRALAMPHTYTGALLIGATVTLTGAALTMLGALARKRHR